MTEKYRWLAAIIAAHPDRKIVGRTRLQKTVKLLQRLGVPMDYDYMIHFYGPYSDGVQADIGLLEKFGLVEEESCVAQGGAPYFILRATEKAASLVDNAEFKPFRKFIDQMSATDAVVLELAATYDAFREMDADHDAALKRLRRKKGTKCEGGRENQALNLLNKLGLPHN